MQTWTQDHRQAVGRLVADEIARQGLSTSAAASKADVSTKTLDRIRKGNPGVSPATVVAAALRLGLAADAVQPPRPDEEQAQLDRIEAMLQVLLARVTPSDELVAEVEAAARQRDRPLPSRARAAKRKPGKGQAA